AVEMLQFRRLESTSLASCLQSALPAFVPEHFVPVHADPGAISLCTFAASFDSFSETIPKPTPTPAATTAPEPSAMVVIHFARGVRISVRSGVAVQPIAPVGRGASGTR